MDTVIDGRVGVVIGDRLVLSELEDDGLEVERWRLSSLINKVKVLVRYSSIGGSANRKLLRKEGTHASRGG